MKKLPVFLNWVLRASILYFLVEVLLNPADPRFAGKAIPERNFVVFISLSLLFPILYFWKKPWPFGRAQGYPFWWDNLYLSIFWLDMLGNSFNLYDTYFYFDLFPHFHGTGAIALVFYGAFLTSALGAIGLAQIIHILLEAQEFYTDVWVATHNVRGTFDVINDLVVGILGSVVYVAIWYFVRTRVKNAPKI